MKRFRLLTGRHVGEDGKKYEKGSIVESPYDLVKMFPNKFKRLASNTSEDEEDTGSGEDNLPKDENEDVTDKFPDAIEADLKVHKVGKLYVVTDPDDEDAGQLNEDDLTSQEKVKAFIADYTSE